MPISGDIYNAFAPKVQSPMDVQNGLMQADAQRAAAQSHQMQLVQQQRAMQQEDALRQATIASQGDPAAMRTALAQGGNYAALQKHDLNQATIAKEGAATAKDKAEAFHKTTVEMARQFGAVDPNDNQGLSTIISNGVKAGVIPERSIPDILQAAGEAGTPQRAQWHAQQKAQAMSEVERQQRDLEAMKQREQVRQFGVTSSETEREHKERDSIARGQLGVAQGHLSLSRAADARASSETRKPPPGYRVAPDGQSLEAIPGGPADQTRQNGKPLQQSVVKQITEARDNAATIDRAASSFKDDFASKGVLGIGADASLAAKGVLGVDGDSVDWWKNYRKQTELVERHALFGAALTPGEQNSWRSADISPGMDAKVIKRNLATRAALARKIADNTKQDMIDAGHNPERIESIAGRNTKVDVPKTVTRTGMHNGKKVVEYSDGTVDYAN